MMMAYLEVVFSNLYFIMKWNESKKNILALDIIIINK